MGNRCQNAVIQPFSLLNARRSARDNRSIPRHIYQQKHAILDRKAGAEEALKEHRHKIEHSWTNIIPLTTFTNNYIIDSVHRSSLLVPYNSTLEDAALLDWLGIGCGQVFEDFGDLEGVETNMSK